MRLNEIKEHYEKFQDWLHSLKNVENEVWLAPIAEGKWSTAAIISHLLFWDRHSLTERFPFFTHNAVLENFPNFQEINDSAREYAHSGISKEQLIGDIVSEREKYFEHINQLSEEDLNIAFSIGNHTLTIADYFKDFMEHDLHHQKQIREAIPSV